MEKNVINKLILITLLISSYMLQAQDGKVYTKNHLMLDSFFNFSDYYVNYSISSEKKSAYNAVFAQRQAVFSHLKAKFKDVEQVYHVKLVDAKWGGSAIKSITTLDNKTKALEMTIFDNTMDIKVSISSNGAIKAARTPAGDFGMNFTGEHLIAKLPIEFNESYVFLNHDLLEELNEERFSYLKMNRIIEGYMLLIQRNENNYNSKAYLYIFRSFIDIKNTDELKLNKLKE
ncbi:MAG: hypothetical protein ACPGJS_00435 [Flammeovirgaceae bacterium]